MVDKALEMEKRLPMTPIAAIKYDGGRKTLAVMKEDIGGDLKPAFLDAEDPEMNFIRYKIGDPRRNKNYTDYAEIAVVQMDLGALELDIQPSIAGPSTVTARIAYINPETKEERATFLSEERLAGIFTGETGRIEVFSGDAQPEQIALVLDETLDTGEKFAIFCFFSPKDTPGSKRNSITGFYEFLHSMNTQFEQNAHTNFQDEVLESYDRDVKRGKIRIDGRAAVSLQHGSGVLAELIKCKAILLARQGRVEELEYMIPSLRPGLITKLLKDLHDYIDRKRGVTYVGESLFESLKTGEPLVLIPYRSDAKPSKLQLEAQADRSLPEPPLKPKQIANAVLIGAGRSERQVELDQHMDRLGIRTPEARKLRCVIDPIIPTQKILVEGYLKEIPHLLKGAQSANVIDDIDIMIREIKEQCADLAWQFNWFVGSDDNKIYTYSTKGLVNSVTDYEYLMRNNLNKKRLALAKVKN